MGSCDLVFNVLTVRYLVARCFLCWGTALLQEFMGGRLHWHPRNTCHRACARSCVTPLAQADVPQHVSLCSSGGCPPRGREVRRLNAWRQTRLLQGTLITTVSCELCPSFYLVAEDRSVSGVRELSCDHSLLSTFCSSLVPPLSGRHRNRRHSHRECHEKVRDVAQIRMARFSINIGFCGLNP